MKLATALIGCAGATIIAFNFGYVWAFSGVLGDNKHPEYHYNGMIGQERVMYREETVDIQDALHILNPDYEHDLRIYGYVGTLNIEKPDGTGFELSDYNNNLEADGGDSISIRGKDGTVQNFTVKLSNPNIASIAKELQPRIDATLEKILQQNTAALRE